MVSSGMGRQGNREDGKEGECCIIKWSIKIEKFPITIDYPNVCLGYMNTNEWTSKGPSQELHHLPKKSKRDGCVIPVIPCSTFIGSWDRRRYHTIIPHCLKIKDISKWIRVEQKGCDWIKSQSQMCSSTYSNNRNSCSSDFDDLGDIMIQLYI